MNPTTQPPSQTNALLDALLGAIRESGRLQRMGTLTSVTITPDSKNIFAVFVYGSMRFSNTGAVIDFQKFQ